MAPTDKQRSQILFDVHQFELSADEEQMLRADLDGLALQTQYFPVADIHVAIEGNHRTNEVTVKLRLMLPGTTLVVNDHDTALSAAFHRCLDSLLDQVQAYKDRLGDVPERRKSEEGTLQELHAPVAIDGVALESAVTQRDYAAFRTLTFSLEEGLRKRVGRWVQRYPDIDAHVGKDVKLADIVEEIFLTAFEGYPHRPPDVPFGSWLEDLIDPAIKSLRQHPERELENVHLAQAARIAEQGSAAE